MRATIRLEAVPRKAIKLAKKAGAPLSAFVALALEQPGGWYELRLIERSLVITQSSEFPPEFVRAALQDDPPGVLRLGTQRRGSSIVEWQMVEVTP